MLMLDFSGCIGAKMYQNGCLNGFRSEQKSRWKCQEWEKSKHKHPKAHENAKLADCIDASSNKTAKTWGEEEGRVGWICRSSLRTAPLESRFFFLADGPRRIVVLKWFVSWFRVFFALFVCFALLCGVLSCFVWFLWGEAWSAVALLDNSFFPSFTTVFHCIRVPCSFLSLHLLCFLCSFVFFSVSLRFVVCICFLVHQCFSASILLLFCSCVGCFVCMLGCWFVLMVCSLVILLCVISFALLLLCMPLL